MHILKRYSEFEELHTLKKNLPVSGYFFHYFSSDNHSERSILSSLHSLPYPKVALARFRPAFLDGRRKLLQFGLASVLLNPELGGRDDVRSWVLR